MNPLVEDAVNYTTAMGNDDKGNISDKDVLVT